MTESTHPRILPSGRGDEEARASAEATPPAPLSTEVLDGRDAHLTGDIRRAPGRAPQNFTGYARDAAATGVWRR
ncbi:hypothetical protein OHA77_21120 [Streptosporangium sp. NBC_01639]|uniref:hypothetical protein n=1 Tax=Streptosporangium sp. NBC_01639 TaxID=2975948 RepID=UPI003867F5BC|nr:hypothetical protein OHA77_21120 [Streptosporangium sp. NBC_01639]